MFRDAPCRHMGTGAGFTIDTSLNAWYIGPLPWDVNRPLIGISAQGRPCHLLNLPVSVHIFSQGQKGQSFIPRTFGQVRNVCCFPCGSLCG